jgi:hypothetical protein
MLKMSKKISHARGWRMLPALCKSRGVVSGKSIEGTTNTTRRQAIVLNSSNVRKQLGMRDPRGNKPDK